MFPIEYDLLHLLPIGRFLQFVRFRLILLRAPLAYQVDGAGLLHCQGAVNGAETYHQRLLRLAKARKRLLESVHYYRNIFIY